MKKSRLALVVLIAGVVVCLSLVGTTYCQETAPLTVLDPAICLDVVNHSPVDPNDVFPAQVGKLFCFTRIQGAQADTEITHVWYFGDIERARIKLDVRSANFRTFSSKIIRPHEIGAWHVDVLGPDDKLLKMIDFEIVQ